MVSPLSVLWKSSAAFTDATLPKPVRDPIINAGSKYLYDFLNPYCNPLSDGVLPGGSSFRNMVDDAVAPTATVGSNNARLSNAAGKAGLVIGAGLGNLTLGAVGVYDRAILNHEFLSILWMKMPVSGYQPNYPAAIFQGAGPNRNGEQFWIDMGSSGLQPSLVISNPSSVTSGVATAANITPGVPFQVAFHWVPGISMACYLNGVLSASNTTSIPSTLLSAAAYALAMTASGIQGTCYRVYEEDMFITRQSLPGVSVAAIVAADYANNNGRFV